MMEKLLNIVEGIIPQEIDIDPFDDGKSSAGKARREGRCGAPQ